MCKTNEEFRKVTKQQDTEEQEFTEEMRQKILATLEAFKTFRPGTEHGNQEDGGCG